MPQKFDRSPIAGLLKNTGLEVPPFAVAATMTVPARTAVGALSRALDRIDSWRGLVNYILNRDIISLYRTGPPKPVNAIQLGPFHTVHKGNGALAAKMFWFDIAYPRHLKAENLQGKWPRIESATRAIKRKLTQSPEKAFYYSMFRRYARALDGDDHHGSFLKLWSLLEYLTDIKSADYDKLVRRVLFLSTDREYDRGVLQHLREQRNSFVHATEESHEPLTLLIQLKLYVEALIYMHLATATMFKRREFWSLLDLPTDTGELRNQIKTRKMAVWFRRAWEKDATNTMR